MNSIIFIIIFGFSEAFIEPKTTEKMFTQIKGFVNFALQIEEIKPVHQDITFFLYTKKNPVKAMKLFVNDRKNLQNSTFNFELPTIFITHGYTDHNERDIIVNLRKVLVECTDSNVIVVDWRRLAGFVYFNAASNAITVGKYLIHFLKFLDNCNVDLASVHLIGHSLGGQISGIAGAGVEGRIGRITALDPAGPLFEYIYIRNSTESLDKNDAKFVDVIHTAGLTFGVMNPIGHADFYPNDGMTPQPGCVNILTAVSCSHIRSVDFFTESVNATVPFLAKQCLEWDHNTLQNCRRENLVPMGYHLPKSTRGNFYLQTHEGPPYAMGNKFYKRK